MSRLMCRPLKPALRDKVEALEKACRDAPPIDPEYPPAGYMIKKRVKGSLYWVYRRTTRSFGGSKWTTPEEHLCPVHKPFDAVRKFPKTKEAYLARKTDAAMLRRKEIFGPNGTEAAILEAFSNSHLFDDGTTIVSAQAYDAYQSILAAKLARRPMLLEDESLTHLTVVTASRVDRFVRALRNANLEFDIARADLIPNVTTLYHETGVTIRLDHAQNRDNDEFIGNYLCRDSVIGLVTCNAGILVRVPAPEKFLIYIIEQLSEPVSEFDHFWLPRRETIAQATTLFDAIVMREGQDKMTSAWLDAPRIARRIVCEHFKFQDSPDAVVRAIDVLRQELQSEESSETL